MGMEDGLGHGRDAPAASLVEISRVLEETARIVREHADGGETPAAAVRPVDVRLVRRVIAARRLRAEMIGLPVGDPAWGMALELFAAALDGRRVPQTMLAVVAGVPPSTALRLAKKLVAEGLFTAVDDPNDGRLVLLGLSRRCFERIRAYLATAPTEAGVS